MKLFGKKISEFLFSIVIGGKPKTIKVKSKEESTELMDTLQKASQGDEEALAIIKEKTEKPIEKRLNDIPEITRLNKEASEVEGKFNTTKEKFEKDKEKVIDLSVLETNEDFVIETNEQGVKSYFLKGFKSDLPIVFVEKIVSLINTGVSYDHLIKFWMLNLLNPNPEARRGLYKYLTKQKMIITSEGYFVTFRRLILVKKGDVLSQVKTNSGLDASIIQEFAAKVKKWRKGQRSFEVYEDSNGTLLLKPIKDHEQNGKSFKFKGTLYDIVEGLKTVDTEKPEIASVDTYTDAHTKTMVIRLSEPVWMDRDKCNSNSKIECSFGLHVGTPEFVDRGYGFGSVIVAVLVNPQHVVSVPYADAHKMRVGEYYPFKVLTIEELRDFDKIDINKYELAYKEYEDAKLQDSYNVIDKLTVKEKEEFKVDRNLTSQEDVDLLIAELQEKKKQISSVVQSKMKLLSDDVSKELDKDEVKLILAKRLGK